LRSGLILVFDVLQRTPLLQPKSTETLSIGTKSKNLQANADGSLTLYAGSKSPGKDKETNWLPGANTPFSPYICCYSPKQEVISAAWKPPKVEQVK